MTSDDRGDGAARDDARDPRLVRSTDRSTQGRDIHAGGGDAGPLHASVLPRP